ncbi:unnamed protein product, partial [Ectocarpus sp. 12 AP-2014]
VLQNFGTVLNAPGGVEQEGHVRSCLFRLPSTVLALVLIAIEIKALLPLVSRAVKLYLGTLCVTNPSSCDSTEVQTHTKRQKRARLPAEPPIFYDQPFSRKLCVAIAGFFLLCCSLENRP